MNCFQYCFNFAFKFNFCRRYIKAVSAALPMLRINPTSGVEVDTAADFLRAGASSLGFVAPAFPPALVRLPIS
jgi:2-keto-3-deoxy-6-phosphogluconate aldolase